MNIQLSLLEFGFDKYSVFKINSHCVVDCACMNIHYNWAA